MPTPKFDQLCVDFVKMIPDQLEQSNFVPGTGNLPRSYLLPATTIIDYVNRGLITFFNNYWKSSQGNAELFLSIFPEMQATTQLVEFTNGVYVISSPYKNFFKIVGGYIEDTPDKIYLKVVPSSKFSEYQSGKLIGYRATDKDPVILQIENTLHLFPKVKRDVVFHYIKLPTLPTTGTAIIQNGNYDNPFTEQWNKEIVDVAYNIYLAETLQTT